jgi:uncharacterized protein (DUF1778 family)
MDAPDGPQLGPLEAESAAYRELTRNDYTMEGALEKASQLVHYVKVSEGQTVSFADALAICMQGQLVDAIEAHSRDFWDYYREKVLGQ